MKTAMLRSALFMCAVTTAVLPVPHHCLADGIRAFPQTRVIIYGDGTPGPYEVGEGFIGGTASVDTTSSTQELSILSADSRTGTIIFNAPLAAGDSLAVTLSTTPPWVAREYRRTNTRRQPLPYPILSEPASGLPVPRPFPGLSFGGSKTFDINAGTESEVALNQTLRLNITGNLTEDITLRAAISDQNTPISPEGDTRELEELDRIMIELKGRHFTANMGDTDIRRQDGKWLAYERRLSGAEVSIGAGGFEIFGSGAVSEGRHMSVTIPPVEGNQGPYRLIRENGQRTISIIPGTENVWINGEILVRGNTNDYTIDYTTGELLFTERRIIGEDMRIVCDYEYTSESYLRNFYSAGAKGTVLDNRLKLNVIAAREADNSSKFILGDLNASMKHALAESGDAPAVIDGITPASDDSTGTYDLIDGHLVFNPAGEGDYNATFSWIGLDQGSYRYRGGGVYEYVPPDERFPGSGTSYDPVVTVPGPVAHDLAGVQLSFDPVPSVHFETELAGSSVDVNTLSSVDDADNSAGAYRFGISLSPEVDAGLPLKLELSGKHHARDKAFSPLDRDRSAEENRRWGMPLILTPGMERISEFAGGLSVHEGTFAGSTISLDGGQGEFGKKTVSRRVGGSGRLAAGERGDADFRIDRIEREGVPGGTDERIDRLNFSVETSMAGFVPAIVFEREQVESAWGLTRGTAYNDVLTRLSTPRHFGLTGKIEWFYRNEMVKHEAWADSSFVRGGSIGGETARNAFGMFRAQYSRRERRTGTYLVETDQAILDYSYRPEEGFLRLDGSYRAGRSREASKRKNYLFTGTDRGAYRWEDENGDGVRDQDEFIPDPHGSYYLYEETLDDYTPVNVVSVFGTARFDLPTDIIPGIISPGMKKIQSETTFEINEKSTAPSSDIFLLNLHEFRKKGMTTSGDMRVQEDIILPLIGGGGSLRLRYFRFDRYNAEFVTGAERRGDEELSLRLRLPVTDDYDAEFTITNASWTRTMENRSIGDYRVESLSGDAEVSAYPVPRTKLGLNIGGGSDHDRISGITSRYVTVQPSATYRPSGKGRFEVSYRLVSVTLDGYTAGSRLPYTMARGQKDGSNHEISVIFDYRLSQRMNIIATYTGRKFGGETFENFARAQVRALF